MRLRLVGEAVLFGQTAVHDVIATGDVNDRVIAIKRRRVVKHLLVIKHRDPNSLRASDRLARKCHRVRRWLAAMKPHRSMPFQPKADRIEVRDAEANRVVTPLVQSEVMHRDRDSDLLKRLPLKKPGHRDRCLPNQYRLVLMMDSHRVWMTNQSHVAALHLP